MAQNKSLEKESHDVSKHVKTYLSSSFFDQNLSKSAPSKSSIFPKNEKKAFTCVKKLWKPTVPQSPKLSYLTRKKVCDVLSYDEKEEMIAQKIKKDLFKATRFDRKIYDSKAFQGIPRIESKPITIPKNVVFHSDKRIEARKLKLSSGEK